MIHARLPASVNAAIDDGSIVYDLDGTLVTLAVNWNAAARAVTDVFDEAGVDTAETDLWSLLEVAPAHGLADELEAVLGAHERRGAERSIRLPLADHLRERSSPVGVCSLNAESACRVALARHDLLDGVDAVVGRDSVGTHKPDPEPLLTTIDHIGADPETTLFVGDSERDAETAARAGVAFEWVDDVVARALGGR
jgi:phosphoglycolate phosphatase